MTRCSSCKKLIDKSRRFGWWFEVMTMYPSGQVVTNFCSRACLVAFYIETPFGEDEDARDDRTTPTRS